MYFFFVLKKKRSTYRVNEKTKNIDHKFKFLENTKTYHPHTSRNNRSHLVHKHRTFLTWRSIPTHLLSKHSSRKIISPHLSPPKPLFYTKITYSPTRSRKNTHINSYTYQYISKYYTINITHIQNKKHSPLNMSRDQISRKILSYTSRKKHRMYHDPTETKQKRLEEVKYHWTSVKYHSSHK